MERYENLKFAVYFNKNNLHITIHKIPSTHKLDPHRGIHKYNQGSWGYFATKREALEFSKYVSKGRELPEMKHCTKCFKESNLQS